MQQPPDLYREINPGSVTPNVVATLETARPWTMMFAILGDIGVVSYGLLTIASAYTSWKSGVYQAWLLTAIIAGLTAVGFTLARHLMRFSSTVTRLVGSRAQADLEEALLHQARYWRGAGIFTVVMFVACVLGMIMMGEVMASLSTRTERDMKQLRRQLDRDMEQLRPNPLKSLGDQ